MTQVKCCADVPPKLVYDTFTLGFADYMIQMSLTEEEFFNYFFGREGNQLIHSFIAIDEETSKGLGVVLGGIRQFRGKRTMRCGGFCVLPEYRGSEVASLMLKKHKEEAEATHCQQLYLEVIDGNDRAKRFYEKNGYHFGKHLFYYTKVITNTDAQSLAGDGSASDITSSEGLYTILPLTFTQLKDFRESQPQLQLNWQNEIESVEKLEGRHWGLFIDNQIIGALSQYKNSIQFIAVSDKYKGLGYGRLLLGHAIQFAKDQAVKPEPEIANQEKPLTTVRFSFPENPEFEGFLKHFGFSADALSQNEMWLELTNAN